MLETEIKCLSQSIKHLISILETKDLKLKELETKIKSSEILSEPVYDLENQLSLFPEQSKQLEEDFEVFQAKVRVLAKSKIDDGIPRKDIKAIITSLGGKSIGDLDMTALSQFNKKLGGL